jgi:predicted amidohydrolase YtcJ
MSRSFTAQALLLATLVLLAGIHTVIAAESRHTNESGEAAVGDTGSQQYADTVLRNGAIYTLDALSHQAEALAVKEGVITFVGSDMDIPAHVGPNTTVIDLKGRMVMPGLIDSHMHVLSGGLFLLTCNLNYQPLAIEGVVAHVQGCIDSEPNREAEGAWLEVVNMDYPSLVTKSGPQTKSALDKLLTKRPVLIRSSDYHTVFTNSRALQLSNITADTPDPPSGKIERLSASQEPSGLLQDDASRLLVGPPPPTEADNIQAGKAALKLLREAGITTFQDAAAGTPHHKAFSAIKNDGNLTARAYFDWRIEAPASATQVTAVVNEASTIISQLNDNSPISARPTVKWQAIKGFLDGVITYPANTGAVIEPYRVPLENSTEWVPDPSSLNDPYWPVEILDATVEALLLRGIDAQFHADGDLAVRVALDAVANFRAKHPGETNYRVGIAHDELTHPNDWPRFKGLNVDPIMSFQWAQPSSFWIPSTFNSMGPERQQYLEAFQDIFLTGQPIVYGSDWPVSNSP